MLSKLPRIFSSNFWYLHRLHGQFARRCSKKHVQQMVWSGKPSNELFFKKLYAANIFRQRLDQFTPGKLGEHMNYLSLLYYALPVFVDIMEAHHYYFSLLTGRVVVFKILCKNMNIYIWYDFLSFLSKRETIFDINIETTCLKII